MNRSKSNHQADANTDSSANRATAAPRDLHREVDHNTALVDRTLAQQPSTLIARLFPHQSQQAIQEFQQAQLKTGFDYRKRALEMAVETKLQAVEELCNHLLVTGKSETRRRRQEFFAEQKLKLQQTMDNCADRFNQDMEQRFERLNGYQVTQVREREEQRLLTAIDQFHNMLDHMGREFMDIIQEGVSR